MEGRDASGQAFRISIPGSRSKQQQLQSVRWQRVRVVKSVQTKVCIDGSLMKEYVLDEPLTTGFLKFLERFGTVRYLEHLKKPYFSFEKEHFLSVKGFIGDCNVEVRYKKEYQDLVTDYFHLLLFYEREGERGIMKLKGIEETIWKKIKIRMGPSDRNGS
jgi:hypothetical protein